MTTSLSTLHDFYPQILSWKISDFKKIFMNDTSTNQRDFEKSIYYGLAKDAKRVREGITTANWAGSKEEILSRISADIVATCFQRLIQISRIPEAQNILSNGLSKLGINSKEWSTDIFNNPNLVSQLMSTDEFYYIKSSYQNWEDVFVNTPVQRMSVASEWKKPFEAIDKKLSESNYPIPEDILEKTHEHISRGHCWIGVGEWSISNRNYINALIYSISTNNIDATEAITRFLVDNYIASRDFNSAISLAIEFLNSQAFRRTPNNYMTRQIFESLAFGLVRDNRNKEAQEILGRIASYCDTRPLQNSQEWHIYQLLRDIYSFRNHKVGLFEIDTTSTTVNRMI